MSSSIEINSRKMVFNDANNHFVHRANICCTLTCLYLPALLLILHYTDNLYRIGKLESFPVLLTIVLMELIKFGISATTNELNFKSHSSRLAKLINILLKLKLKELLYCTYLFGCAFCVYYLLTILFGAPLLSEYEQTFMFASFMSLLTVFPSCLHLGSEDTLALLTASKPLMYNSLCEMILRNLHLTVLGAWLGAIVLPLDWDKPWQQWPISCCLGAILGCILSHVLSLMSNMSILNVFKTKLTRSI